MTAGSVGPTSTITVRDVRRYAYSHSWNGLPEQASNAPCPSQNSHTLRIDLILLYALATVARPHDNRLATAARIRWLQDNGFVSRIAWRAICLCITDVAKALENAGSHSTRPAVMT
jgi:hypothetical protein